MIINLKNILKTYPECESPALNNINLSIKSGEIITLLGPSGCGKTTLLRLIAGLEKPDQGEIYIKNNQVTGNQIWVPPEKREVGMVFQDFALFPHLNVQQNIAFALQNMKISEEQKKNKINSIIKLVGLSGLSSQNPADLSGGQQQRVALARALIQDPLLVMLDEPFNNLDMNLRSKMQKEITNIIHKSGTTAVFVTHNQKEALSISNKVIVMDKGQIEQKGTPRQIYEKPKTKFVASFVGQSNILSGTIGKEKNTVITPLGRLSCRTDHNKKPGTRVDLSIKPEDIKINSSGSIQGTILSQKYKGQYVEAVISIKTSSNTKSPNKNLNIYLTPDDSYKKGDKLSLSIPPKNVNIISS